MRPPLIAPLLTIALVAIAAPAATRDRDRIPEAVPDGAPVSCISNHAIDGTSVRSDSVIDFEMIGHKVYRNTLPSPCPGLESEGRFLYKTSIDQLCSVDIITVLHSPPSPPGASCGLGQFQPVKLVKPARH